MGLERAVGKRNKCHIVVVVVSHTPPFEFRLRQCNQEYLDKRERTTGVPILISIGSFPQLD